MGKRGLLQDGMGFQGFSRPTQLARVDIVAQGTELWLENAGTVSSALVFVFHILCYLFLFWLP